MVEVLRGGRSTRRFDIKLHLNLPVKPVEIQGIDKIEQNRLVDYFKDKKVEVTSEKDAKQAKMDD